MWSKLQECLCYKRDDRALRARRTIVRNVADILKTDIVLVRRRTDVHVAGHVARRFDPLVGLHEFGVAETVGEHEDRKLAAPDWRLGRVEHLSERSKVIPSPV